MVKVEDRSIDRIEFDLVVRFKDEELWLRKLQYAIKRQKKCLLHVIGIDNNSIDDSCNILKSMVNYGSVGSVNIKNIEDFMPGAALNLGASIGNSDFIVNLSAHCIPKGVNYFSELLNFFLEVNSKEDCAGVYSRQLPIEGSGAQNTIDLVLAYPRESRIYRRTPIFNNASSLIPRLVWNKNKFNESVSNLEDFIWAKKIMELGFVFGYTPTAEVYHQHGLHQHNIDSSSRAEKSLQVLLKNKWIVYNRPWFISDVFINTYKIQIEKTCFGLNECLRRFNDIVSKGKQNKLDKLIYENDYFVFYNELNTKKDIEAILQDTSTLTSEYTIITKIEKLSVFECWGILVDNNFITNFGNKMEVFVLSSRMLKRLLIK